MKTKDRMEERRQDGRSNRKEGGEGRGEGGRQQDGTRVVRSSEWRARFGSARPPLEGRARLQLS